VARAVRACPIPVVTGVGHETDFTIADFAADRRAPTPTAAAELVSPERRLLLEAVAALARKIDSAARREIERRMLHVDQLARRLVHPGARLRAQADLLAQLRLRLGSAAARLLVDRQAEYLLARLRVAAYGSLERAAARCAAAGASLSHLDPGRVLERGYSIVQKADGRVVSDSAALAVGESVVLRFARGGAEARIETTHAPAKPAAA
jgi:exodeoxyribonuclease VII large subunit